MRIPLPNPEVKLLIYHHAALGHRLKYVEISGSIWLFKIAMENGPFIDGKIMIYLFKMLIFQFAALNCRRVINITE
jgi:hypothetical protein